MTDSWDRVAKHERRRNIRLAMALATLLVLLYSASDFLGLPLTVLRRLMTSSDNGFLSHEQVTNTHLTEPAVESTPPADEQLPSVPADASGAKPSIHKPVAPEIIVSATLRRKMTSNDPGSFEQFDNSVSAATASETKSFPDEYAPTVPVEVGVTRPRTPKLDAPEIVVDALVLDFPDEEFDPQLKREADARLQKMTRRIAAVDGTSNRLQVHGGEQWAHIQQLARDASALKDPRQALQAANEAITLLDKLSSDIEFNELREVISEAGSEVPLDAIVEFVEKHPNHSRRPELRQTVLLWDLSKWQSLAVSELDACGPDDGGFAEA